MKTVSLCPHLAALLSLATASANLTASGQALWINEFHYDNTGTDIDEFVEIAAPESLTELASVRLTLYNGGDGKPYGNSHLLSSFTPGESVNGIRFYSKPITGLQNGLLTWSDPFTNSVFAVEWAPTVTGAWSRSWSALTNIPYGGTITTSAVPMFYRIIRLN